MIIPGLPESQIANLFFNLIGLSLVFGTIYGIADYIFCKYFP